MTVIGNVRRYTLHQSSNPVDMRGRLWRQNHLKLATEVRCLQTKFTCALGEQKQREEDDVD